MMKKFYFAAAALCLGGLILSSSTEGQSLTFPQPPRPYLQNFLNLKSDPQTLGMGGVYLAQGQEAGHSLWNPATLPNLSGVQTSLSFGRHASEHIKWSSLDIVSRHWGFGLVALLDTNLPLPSFLTSTPQQKSVDYGGIGKIAFAGKLHRVLNLGVMLKPTYIEWHKTTLAAGAFRQRLWGGSVDVGLHAPISPHFGLGVVAQDLAGALEYQVLGKDNSVIETHWVGMPVRFSAGTQLAFSDRLNFALEAERLGDNPIYHFGSRWRSGKLPFSLWAGVYGNKDEFKNWKTLNWSTGLGVQLWGQEINYAFLEEAGFSPSHVVGGSLNLARSTGVTAPSSKPVALPSKKEFGNIDSGRKDTGAVNANERKSIASTLPSERSSATTQAGQNTKTATSAVQPKFPENFYTYKSLFHSANDFALMANDLQVQLAKAQEDKIFGFRETTESFSCNKLPNSLAGYLFHWADWEDSEGYVNYSLLDMNNDRLPDFVIADAAMTKERFHVNGWIVFLNSRTGFKADTCWTWPSNSSPSYLADQTVITDNTYTDRSTFDINGDGYPDIVDATSLPWKVAYNQMPAKMGFSDFQKWVTPFNEPHTSRWYYADSHSDVFFHDEYFVELLYETFDITGDSIPDFVCYRSDSQQIWWYVYEGYYDKKTGGGFKAPKSWEFDLPDQADFLINPSNKWHPGAISRLYPNMASGNCPIIEVTKDMNGDGRPDHVFSTAKGYWYVAMNNGRGFDTPTKWQAPVNHYAGATTYGEGAWQFFDHDWEFISLFPQDYSSRHSVISDLVDINGDGKADFIDASNYGGLKGWSVCVNTGNGFEPAKVFYADEKYRSLHESWDQGSESWSGTTKHVWLIDMNGDKCPDLVDSRGGENTGYWKVYINTIAGAERLANLNDAFKIRSIQAKLAEGHEAYFHEEYVLALNAYATADEMIRKLVGEDKEFEAQNVVSSAKRLGVGAGDYPYSSLITGRRGQFSSVIRTGSAGQNLSSTGAVWSQQRPITTRAGAERQTPVSTSSDVTRGGIIVGGKERYQAEWQGSDLVKNPTTISGRPIFVFDPDVLEHYEEDVRKKRVSATNLDSLVLNKMVCDDPQAFVLYLPYIRDFVLPLCMGDVYLEMGNYLQAEGKYTQAAEDSCLNLSIETRLLWLKFSELCLRWANELFKASYSDGSEPALYMQATELYQRVLISDFPLFKVNATSGDPQSSACTALKNAIAKAAKGLQEATSGKNSLYADIKAITIDPKTSQTQILKTKAFLMDFSLFKKPTAAGLDTTENPQILSDQLEAVNNLVKLNNGMNYLGYTDNVLPIWRYSYLSSVSRSFAQHEVQLEREAINFKVTAENEAYTNRQMVQSIGLNKFNQMIEQYKVEQAAWQTAISKINEKMAGIQRQDAYERWQSLKDQKENALTNGWIGGVVSTVGAFIAGATVGAAKGAFFGPYGAIIGGVAGGVAATTSAISNNTTRAQLNDEIDQAEYQYNQAQLAEQSAGLQIIIAQINQQISIVQRDIANLNLAYAQENLAYLQNKEFNAELWYKLASAVRELSRQYLDAAIELALLMEKAYNFETGRDMHKIRLDYTRNDLSGLLAGDYLLRDIDSFEYDRAVHIKEKDIPIKHVVSLASTRPLQFFKFNSTGEITFATTLEEFSRAYPGAYNCRIKEVELIIEGLLPPTGISGTLSNGCYSMVRMPMPEIVDKYKSSKDVQWRIHGAYYDTTKTHEMETMVLSKYTVREDRMVFTPPPEQTGIFENTGVATEWTLRLPMSANNLDFNTISDVKLVISFTAQFDPQLDKLVRCNYVMERNAHPEKYKTLTMFSARYQFPDEFYHFANSVEAGADTAALRFHLNKYAFPLNEQEFKADSVYLVFFPPDSLGEKFSASLVLKNEDNQSAIASGETDKGQNGIMRFKTSAFIDKKPFGDWTVRVTKENFTKGKLSRLHDVWICLNYRSKVKDLECATK